MRITKGLIIADPWIGYILDGSKCWEMRSTTASHRGSFGLIRKGTGAVHGVARLVDVGASLSPTEMIATFEHHRIPEHMIRSGEVAKWNTPWKLADVRRLDCPVPYQHKSGAVTWVDLDDGAIDAIACQIQDRASVEDTQAFATRSAVPAFPGRLDLIVDVSQRGRKIILDIELKHSAPETGSSAVRKAVNVLGAPPVTVREPEASPLMDTRPSLPVAATGRSIGEVEITEGNLANNHLYLRSIFDRFPADAVGGSNKASVARQTLTIEWGGPEPVVTDLDGQKKFFRARGWIGAFYKLNKSRAGDRVLIEELAPYRYRVSLKRALVLGRVS